MQNFQINKEKYFKAIGYAPESPQWDVHRSNKRWRINVQGRRSGKSYSAAREAEAALFVPETRGWIVAPTYDLAGKIGREVHQMLGINLGFIQSKRMVSGQMFYAKCKNGSELWLKSADRPDSLLGEGLDFIVGDEVAVWSKIIFEQYLRPTLSDRLGWFLGNTTPRGFNWIYDLYQRGQSNDFPEWDSWQHPSSSSRYFRDSLSELKRELTKETYEQEILARFTSFAGKVFPFDRNTHVKKIEFNPAWETFCSIDFGYRMPAVIWAQVGKVEGGHEIHIIDEIIHETDIRTEELADKILAKGYPVQKYFCDPAGEGVQSSSGLGDVTIFRRKEISPISYKTDKISRALPSGIDLVRSYLENAEGKSRLFISDICKGIIVDFENYRYPEKKEERRLRDEPLKDGYHDHGMDAVRYFFINRFPIVKREAIEVQRYW